MASRRRFIAWWTAAAAALLVGSFTPSAEADRAELAIIVAADSPVSGLSFYELKMMYKGDRVMLPGGQPAIPLNRGTGSAERSGFDQSVLGMSPKEVAQFWIDRKIRGKSNAPKAVDPGDLVARVVARLGGAVGYVRPDQVTGDVKVVAIDGKKPGSSGYPVAY
ncbi:MAG: hypothetical protein JW751_14505 [Polyangiaceae bacterium]|nr:hypothetical protein [Polyangiaceae bacterium]